MKKRAQKKVTHKPNARHTLSEVLHSLQDMMNNELSSISENGTDKRADNNSPVLSKEDVMNSLKELIGEASTVDNTLEATAIDASEDSPDEISDEPQSNEYPDEADIDHDADDSSGSDETIANPDIRTTTPSADEFKLEIEEPLAAEPKIEKKPRTRAGTQKMRSSSDEVAHNAGKQAEINWDDIPVLREVVAPPPEPDTATAQQARKIAIKVAAALNIETRKKGGDSLDIKTIMRLQSLLSQELHDHQDDDGIEKSSKNESGESSFSADEENASKEPRGDDT